MNSIQGKSAVIIGASSGVGRATVKALISEGAHVVAVARGREALDALRAEAAEPIQTVQADAADPTTAQCLLLEFRPELVVLAAGVRPRMGALDEQSWETFSEPWNVDTQAAFYLLKAALTMPLAPGSTVVVVSSGAAIAVLSDGNAILRDYLGTDASGDRANPNATGIAVAGSNNTVGDNGGNGTGSISSVMGTIARWFQASPIQRLRGIEGRHERKNGWHSDRASTG